MNFDLILIVMSKRCQKHAKKKTKKVVYSFPRNLKELGYHINEEGKLRTLEGMFVILVYERSRT